MLYAKVILPIPLPKLFTYSVPLEMQGVLMPGNLILAQFGSRKIYTAIVHSFTDESPDYKVKPLLSLEEEFPILTDLQLKFWDWMSGYYMCSKGEIMLASLPAAMRLQSESIIVLNHEKEIDWASLSDRGFLLLEALQNQSSLNLQEAGAILELKNPMPVIKVLLDKQYVLIEEEVKDKVKPRIKKYAKLNATITEEKLPQVFDSLKRSTKQSDLLLAYFKLKAAQDNGLIEERLLLEETGASRPSLKGLYEKEIFDLVELVGGVENKTSSQKFDIKALSEAQQQAYLSIQGGFEENKTALLHGVTSSGKTEIYIKLLRDVLENGQSALYLLPEIALTAQLLSRLQFHFKERMLVYHSKLNNRERLEVWNKILHAGNEGYVVIAARSGVFLPFQNLGLLIVDEEHETSFKQHDPAPRYNGRDAAIMLSFIHKASTLLGSATPSIESYHNALIGKYKLVELMERYGGVKLPMIELVDIKKEYKSKAMAGHFSPKLLDEMKARVAEGEKVILFQNRRGFAPVMKCLTCGHTPECKHCDISLTYHKHANTLRCHYCGYSIALPQRCTACGSSDLKFLGFGTEMIEEELKEEMKDANIARMDFDSTRRKNAMKELVEDFEDGKIDVLVGTQMVAKGLDFDDVQLVGVLNADTLLNFPDFRAHERAFQLMSQVAGRAGRRDVQGKVMIQTFDPLHEVIKWVVDNDYKTLAKEQLYERKQFHYPPFVRMIKITLRHKDQYLLADAANLFAKQLKLKLGDAVLGPEFPHVARLKGQFQKQIILKISRKMMMQNVKAFVLKQADRIFLQKLYARVRVIYDVDPN